MSVAFDECGSRRATVMICGEWPAACTLIVVPELKYRDERGELVTVSLSSREAVIGRLPECDVVLPKPYVSRRHARVFPEQGEWFVEDLGSAGGTFLNRTSLAKRAALTDGDEIGIGDLLVTFSRAGATARPAAQRPPPEGGDARKTIGATPAPGGGEDAFAATNPGYVLPPALADTFAVTVDGAARNLEIRVRTAAGTGAYARIAARSRTLDPAKALVADRTGSLVDAALASTATRLAIEIATGSSDRASIHRRALGLAVRVIGGERAAIALRREGDGAWITGGSVALSGGKLTDSSFPIDSDFVADASGTREGLIAVETEGEGRTLLCSPFLEKERVAGWIFVEAKGARSDLGAMALDLLAYIGSTAAQTAGAAR